MPRGDRIRIGRGDEVSVLGYTALRQRYAHLFRYFLRDRRLLETIGQFLITRIKARTAEGVDVDNQPFMPYSPRYKFFRESQGRSGDIVNLFFTGSMMGSMTSEVNVEQGEVRIFFMPGEDESGTQNPAKASYLQEDRNFFDYNDADVAKIWSIVNNYVANQMGRQNPWERTT